ncbi:malate dehydrogenase, FAD/NAD(P)-binding domain [Pseudomonas sp. OF001]|uniref:malate dehydrogenase (quinone) n=1 Tax=unclassified Pseudomonas TaxID=196821 RepID=UPI0010A5B9A0|nr:MULTISPECIES: malate dehydrogenase (quinone) [unclassified Pseudomonas]THG82213.1 malate dehydrogenase (quinone) [Pseudomonas sp. A-1]CAD5376432.1 malate dehydrogenase, FAD/NAD(P)-binding domain [Pseudomonas sp. OF001]
MMQTGGDQPDLVFVGAGVMSATLAVLLKELDPSLKIEVLEQLESGAAESSFPWNNAGTGHAALCELNYTPEGPDGSVGIAKAVNINAMFEVSRQLWAYLVEQGYFKSPKDFINPVPHMSFVRGEKGVAFLRKRFEAMKAHHCFRDDLEYTEDRKVIGEWAPLLMQGRTSDEPLAATRAMGGTDVNFGALTRKLLQHLEQSQGCKVLYNQKVSDVRRDADGRWRLSVDDLARGGSREVTARFVFLGAGGAALTLLQKSGIEEGKGFGGFPVSGQWLRCDNPEIVRQHQAKVYSQADIGAPPMSVPHLDTRVVDGGKSLLFGPFAGFSTKFLKTGSFLDLPLSIRPNNIGPMLAVARDNMDLTKYLIKEVLQSEDQRLDALRKFFPDAKKEDWRLEIAGQRVQIIKKDAKKGGILQFGTEIVAAADGSIAALLGASPGASVSVSVMLEVIERCFPEQYKSAAWQERLGKIFEASEKALETDGELLRRVRARTSDVLELQQPS